MVRTRHIPPALQSESGTIYKQAAVSVAVGYPAPYSVGASSLGFQWVYKLLNAIPEVACARFFMPERGLPDGVVALETGRPVADMEAVLFSVACEQELMNIAALLKGMGLPPLAADRDDIHPPVIMGGPLTTVDPRLLAPFADVVATGASDALIAPLGEALIESDGRKQRFLDMLRDVHAGLFVPDGGVLSFPDLSIPPPRPAAAATWSPLAEFRNLFLVEATRGCRRGCAFCTMSRGAANTPAFHAFPVSDILEAVPDEAPGVGLVGAAVTDHPEIERIVALLSEKGKRVSLSSIRADRLTLSLAEMLREGGGRTVTLAADGASERLRRKVKKGILEKHLTGAVAIAREAGFQSLKIYSMVGLPDETPDDIVEYARLLTELSRCLKVSTTVQAFVPKPSTPLAGQPMTELKEITGRLNLLRRETRGRVKVLPTSPKWSWVDWKIAHSKEKGARIAIDALLAGGGFAAWKKAIERRC